MSDRRGLLPGLFVAVLLLGFLTLPRWADEAPANRKLEARLDELDKQVRRDREHLKELDGRLVHLSDSQRQLAEQIGVLRPEAMHTLRLKPGGTEKWSLDPGGTAHVQFLRLDESGVPVLLLDNNGGRAEVAMSPGTALRAVDDRGSERRIFTTTLHGLELDRTGRPETATVSVVVTIERD